MFDAWREWAPLAALVGVATLLFYLYLTWTHDHWRRRGVPHLTPLPLFGNFLRWALLRVDAGTLFREVYERSARDADAVGIWVFRRPALVVNSPELIKRVLVKDFAHFADRSTHTDRSHDPLGSDNLFFGKNPHWRVMRARLTHLFSSSKMKAMFGLMNEIGDDLEEAIAAHGDRPVEVKDISARFTTDVIATTAYGLRANALRDERAPFNLFRKNLLDFRWIRAIKFMSIFFMQEIAKIGKCKVFENDCAEWIRNVFWNTVKERENNKDVRGDLIGALISLRDESKEDDLIKFSGDSLVAQAAIFFTAGNESSSTTMSFLLYELALNTDIQDKLSTEILRVLEKNNNQITYEILQEMPFLDMCFKETLRKYSPLPFLDRVCTRDYRLPGTSADIERGTIVYIPMLGLHYDPEHFPDPHRFDPERFGKERAHLIKPFTFFPFGEGPRICIGERFGSMQSRIGMIHIMRRFRVERCSMTQVPLTWLTLALSPTTNGGLYLKFVPRDSAK